MSKHVTRVDRCEEQVTLLDKCSLSALVSLTFTERLHCVLWASEREEAK